MHIKGQQGLYVPGLLLSIGICLLAGYGTGLLTEYLPSDKPSIPFYLLAIMVAPSGVVVQLIGKLNDSLKVKGLSRDEGRRLAAIIEARVYRLYLLLLFYLIATAIIGFLFYASTLSVNFNAILWALRTCGFIVASSVITTLMSISQTTEIQKYEAKIAARLESRKSRRALLKRLSEKTEKDKG